MHYNKKKVKFFIWTLTFSSTLFVYLVITKICLLTATEKQLAGNTENCLLIRSIFAMSLWHMLAFQC